MKLTAQEIKHLFNGRLIGSLYMKKMVCKTNLYLPWEIMKYVTSNVWFISAPQDAWAFTFRGSDIRHQHLIILSDELLWQNEKQIIYTILHEIGHVMLKHRNSIGYEQTKKEIKQQEKEADHFAKKYLQIKFS